MTTLHIKGMVCYRCEVIIRDLMERHGLEVTEVRLGQVTVNETIERDKLDSIELEMKDLRLEIICGTEEIVVKDIRLAVLKMVADGTDGRNNSDYLAMELGRSYASLSKIFAAHEGMSIQKYISRRRIEKVKELLSYGELTLSEIAHQLGYSSVQYLSQQFKQETGVNPTTFKNNLPKLDDK